MSITLVSPGNSTTIGSSNSDIILVQEADSAGTDNVSAGGGNDVIIGDIDNVVLDNSNANATFLTARNIDDPGLWSTQSNPLVADDTIPYATIAGEGSGEVDFFSVTVGAGETLTADIDFAQGALGGPGFDSELTLSNVTVVESPTGLFLPALDTFAENDDSSTSDGGLGSSSG